MSVTDVKIEAKHFVRIDTEEMERLANAVLKIPRVVTEKTKEMLQKLIVRQMEMYNEAARENEKNLKHLQELSAAAQFLYDENEKLKKDIKVLNNTLAQM
jgi:DNA segregation ATPase FtsK/SpoIIIE-like protein